MPNSNILMYTTEDGLTKIEATFENDTVWLSIDQMAELFQRDRSVIGKHVRNIFKEGELDKNSVWAKFAYTASDGKEYNVDYFKKWLFNNLLTIIYFRSTFVNNYIDISLKKGAKVYVQYV